MIYGIGINDSDYKTHGSSNGPRKMCPYYQVWHDMLRRCYSEKHLDKYPTYKGCITCEEWLTFSKFKAWMETQDCKGKHIDKDILGDGKLYSPETCCFVEQWLNNLLTDSGRVRGKIPCGVSSRPNGTFQAKLKIQGKTTYIGYFDTVDEAKQAYQEAKQRHVSHLMENYPDNQIRNAVLDRYGVLV